jgi:hypothetical protein
VSLPLRGHELLSSSVAAGSLERGHEVLLFLNDVRGVLLVVKVDEVVRLIIVDLVEYLDDGLPSWGPVRMENLHVLHLRNRPGGPSYSGRGARLVPQLGVEVGAELRCSTRSVEDGLLLVVDVHGGEGLRGRLVARKPRVGLREGLRGGLVARESGVGYLNDSTLGVVMVGHCCVQCADLAPPPYKDAVGGN